MKMVANTMPASPDRDIDQEDPVPGNERGDEAAERGADQRADQRRQGDPDHRVDQLAPIDAAHQDEARYGRHHRPSHALNDPRHYELKERVRQRAADRAEHEDGDRRAKHRACAEAIGGPAADWNEHRKRQQVGGDRQFERQWARADVGGNRRQRRRDDGRVHVLHEQGDRHDQRDNALCQHRPSAAAPLVARGARRSGTRERAQDSSSRPVWRGGRPCRHVNRIAAASEEAPIVLRRAPPHINMGSA
jgi:hypothetical protein